MSRDEAMRELRAGLFLTVSVAILVVAVFLIGRSQTLFAHRMHLSTEFADTSGLVVGAPVRLAGVDVGVVQTIRFSDDPGNRLVRVTLAVDRRYADRMRADSIARLSSKGLLGDVLIDITVGSAEEPPLADGARLRAQESEGLTTILATLKDAIDQVKTLAGTVGTRVDAVFTDDLAHDLQRVAHAAAGVMEQVESGDGLAHTVIYDKRMSRDARDLLADGRKVAAGALAAVDRVDQILDAVKDGDGTMHALLYGGDGKRLLGDLERAAATLADAADQLRNGKGLLHQLVYENDRGQLVENLTALSRTLRQVGDEVQQGKGTLGALLKDPSVYEDIKGIVGSVQRSRILRSLIRSELKR
jgi:phospholipid/cholesterol/gamma-HCH transport system substrate-binding protein